MEYKEILTFVILILCIYWERIAWKRETCYQKMLHPSVMNGSFLTVVCKDLDMSTYITLGRCIVQIFNNFGAIVL